MNRLNNTNSYFYLKNTFAEYLDKVDALQQLDENYTLTQEELVQIERFLHALSGSVIFIEELINRISSFDVNLIEAGSNLLDDGDDNYEDIEDIEDIEDDDDDRINIDNFSDNVEVKIEGEEPITIGEIKELITYLKELMEDLNTKIIFLEKLPKLKNIITVEKYMYLSSNSDNKLCAYSPPRGQNKDFFCARAAINADAIIDLHELRCENCLPKVGRGQKLLEQYQQQTRNTMKSAAFKR